MSFSDACHVLRRAAEAQAETLKPAPLTDDLIAQGYRPTEISEIRDTLEIFSSGNMPYVLMATLARRLLEGKAWSGAIGTGPAFPPKPSLLRPVLMEPHHADPATQAVFESVKEALGLPFVNTDYRALARWPSYFAAAWPDLEQIVRSPAYDQAVEDVHYKARDLTEALPNPTKLAPETMLQAASHDASVDEVLDVVRLFQWLLPGLTVNVACLRTQLVLR